ncbi:MAG: 3-oxoacyl-[acyl-carrier protein] reductase, partial [uncultured Rubrobacteraceae bacterium]
RLIVRQAAHRQPAPLQHLPRGPRRPRQEPRPGARPRQHPRKHLGPGPHPHRPHGVRGRRPGRVPGRPRRGDKGRVRLPDTARALRHARGVRAGGGLSRLAGQRLRDGAGRPGRRGDGPGAL